MLIEKNWIKNTIVIQENITGIIAWPVTIANSKRILGIESIVAKVVARDPEVWKGFRGIKHDIERVFKPTTKIRKIKLANVTDCPSMVRPMEIVDNKKYMNLRRSRPVKSWSDHPGISLNGTQ
jgi:hypothetical protein